MKFEKYCIFTRKVWIKEHFDDTKGVIKHIKIKDGQTTQW